MIASALKSVSTQGLLWADANEFPIRATAQTRNICGDFFEQATQALTGARRHRTDATADICPDLSVADRAGEPVYLESKSIGRTATSILYLRRLAKDRRFVRAAKRPLYYVLWHHKAFAAEQTDSAALREALAMTLCHCTVLPLAVICDVARARPLKTLNRVLHDKHAGRCGYNTRTYGRGWNVPLSAFEPRCDLWYTHAGLNVGGVVTAPFRVRTVRDLSGILLDYDGRSAPKGN